MGRYRGGRCVTWVKPDGKRARFKLSGSSPSEVEAEAVEIWRRENPPPKEPTVADLWEAKRLHLGDRPTGKTMTYTGNAILAHFGYLRPNLITTEMCREYCEKRALDGVSEGTVWTELGHLQSALKWAHRQGRIQHVPPIEKPSKPAPQERFFTRDEIQRLLNQPGTPHHIQLAMLLMLSTAARVTAVLELTWAQVDLDRLQINLRTPGAKTRKGRAIVPINNGLHAALIEARKAGISEFVVEWAGRKIRSIRKGLKSVGAAAGVDGVTAHVFRHTAAVHMAEAGISMSEISQYLGHSNTSITERVYARYSPTHLRRAADVLDFTQSINEKHDD
ncbi:tyrosine-type recombinase/integrase [Salipiger profundus]|uniref:tyrosine-type recombinase/integrase n=1 Tax=Salipiger profundus TaxID=1229727 RepID=UPI003BF9E7A4